MSDGTAVNMVEDINQSGSSGLFALTEMNGVLYFRANDGENGAELWRSDGTTAGTALWLDILPGARGSFPYGFVGGDGMLFFAADNGEIGYELWMAQSSRLYLPLVSKHQALR